MQYALEGTNIFVTIIAKGIVSFDDYLGIYIQMDEEHDIIGKVRSRPEKVYSYVNISTFYNATL